MRGGDKGCCQLQGISGTKRVDPHKAFGGFTDDDCRFDFMPGIAMLSQTLESSAGLGRREELISFHACHGRGAFNLGCPPSEHHRIGP